MPANWLLAAAAAACLSLSGCAVVNAAGTVSAAASAATDLTVGAVGIAIGAVMDVGSKLTSESVPLPAEP